jgi:hypothetical protein
MERHTMTEKQTNTSASTTEQSCLLCDASMIKVPAWFTVSAGIKVAAAKNVSAILIDEPRKKVLARVVDLKQAHPSEPLARWARNRQAATAEVLPLNTEDLAAAA